MSYTVTKTNGTTLVTVPDQTIDTSATSLSLVGRGAVNYGQATAGNFVRLCENFANSTAPSNPLAGQFWYDTSAATPKVYDGTTWNVISISTSTVTGARASGSRSVVVSITSGSTTYTIASLLSEGNIIAVWSHYPIANGVLPATIVISGVTFNFASRFPNGISPGCTMASDSAQAYVFAGVATSSRYADVAERYETADSVAPGDVVEIGGEKEIQLTSTVGSENIFGVISTSPAVMMNSDAGDDTTHPYVAFVGRVPCKVVGKVTKGDRLVSSSTRGAAMRAPSNVSPFAVLGRALANKDDDDIGVVEIVLSGAK